MRKITALILSAIVLSALFLPAFAAQPVQSQTLELPDGKTWVQSMLCRDGVLYMLLDNELYTLKIGDTEFVKTGKAQLPEGVAWLSGFISDGSSLYSIDWQQQKLYPAELKDGGLAYGEPMDIDLDKHVESHEDEGSSYQTPQTVFAAYGRLWLLYDDHTGGEARALESIDLKTGELKEYAVEGLQQIAKATDGKLYAALAPEGGNDDENVPEAPLKLFNPEDGTLEDVGTIAVGRYGSGLFMFEEETGSLIYSKSSDIFRRRPDGVQERCCALPVGDIWSHGMDTRALLIPGGFVYADYTGNLIIRSTDPQALPRHQLVIYGYQNDGPNVAALLRMPDVSMKRLEDKWFENAKAMGQALVSGEDSIDLMCISTQSMDVSNLYKKGYCRDLSGSEAVKNYIDRLYPFMKDACMQDGKIYAVPVRTEGNPFGINNAMLRKLNLKAPETYAELCAAVKEWSEHADERSEYTFIDTPEKDWLFNLMFSLYMDTMALKGEEMKMDTPLFRQMAAAYESVRPVMESGEEYGTDEEVMEEFYQKPNLMTMYENVEPERLTYKLWDEKWSNDKEKEEGDIPVNFGGTFPHLFRAGDGEETVYGFGLTLMMVNSQSGNADIAVEYLENYIANLEPERYVELCPDSNEPVENERYQRDLERLKEEVEKAGRQCEKAEGAEKSQMEENLKYMRNVLERYEEENRYKITPEAIALYRKLMENGVVRKAEQRRADNEHLGDLTLRYRGGQIDLENFIRETDSKLKLMQLEGQ